jgi:hypothetical protein
MCLNKKGCTCHWGVLNVGPDHARTRPDVSFAIPRVPSAATNPEPSTPNASSRILRDRTPGRTPRQNAHHALMPGQRTHLATNLTMSLRSPAVPRSLTGNPMPRVTLNLRSPARTSVFGIGPSISPVRAPLPTTPGRPRSGVHPGRRAFVSVAATRKTPVHHRKDIWSFMRTVSEAGKASYADLHVHLGDSPHYASRPKSDWLGCVLCE